MYDSVTEEYIKLLENKLDKIRYIVENDDYPSQEQFREILNT